MSWLQRSTQVIVTWNREQVTVYLQDMQYKLAIHAQLACCKLLVFVENERNKPANKTRKDDGGRRENDFIFSFLVRVYSVTPRSPQPVRLEQGGRLIFFPACKRQKSRVCRLLFQGSFLPREDDLREAFPNTWVSPIIIFWKLFLVSVRLVSSSKVISIRRK